MRTKTRPNIVFAPGCRRTQFLLRTALCAWTLFAAGCVHPLGPGFHFSDRQTEIRLSENEPGRIHLRVADQLVNAGDRPLHSLEVRLPEAPSFGEQNLRVRIQGEEVSPQHSSMADPRMVREPFDPVWQQNDKREVVTEWDLRPEPSGRGTIATSAQGFFIADPTAFPLWQAPYSVFARGGFTPDSELLTVFAPGEFRVLAPGKPSKAANEGNLVAHSFLITPANDFLPYVVAGRYAENLIPSPTGSVQFWTFRPIDTQETRAAANRLSAAAKALADFWGPLSSEKTTVRIVEAPVELPSEFGATNDPGAVSFPQGVLLDSRAFSQGIANEPAMQLAEYTLARSWFGWLVRPRADAQILMGRGAGLFGEVVVAERQGPTPRARMVASLIERYDQARAIAPDRRLMEPPEGYSRAERISTGYRAALFFVALEDLCGSANLGAAMRDLIHARAGRETSYEELRAAAEAASGLDLAEMFRKWLVQPGIPEEFRARYRIATAFRTPGAAFDFSLQPPK